MAAGDGAARFDHLRLPACQNVTEHVEIASIGEAHQCERSERLAAHRIHIAKRIRRGDLPERVGIVHDGREEVDGLNQRLCRREQIHAGVVGFVEADKQVGVMLPG